MKLLWMWRSRVGPFYIGNHDGHFFPIFGERSFGSYDRPSQAAHALARGRTFATLAGLDTADLGIPADLGKWQELPGELPAKIRRHFRGELEAAMPAMLSDVQAAEGDAAPLFL